MFKIILPAISNKRKYTAAYAIAGGKNPEVSVFKMELSSQQMKEFLTLKEYSQYLKASCGEEEYWGSISLFSSLFAFSSGSEPLVLYAAEGGTCDTCLEIFLKYGNGQRPNFDELSDMRTCMDNYDSDLNKAANKVEKLMDVMFSEKLYKFEHCMGIMADADGNFSWSRYQERSYVPCASPFSQFGLEVATPDLVEKRKKEDGAAIRQSCKAVIFLLASQPESSYSAERVEYYRQRIRSGERFGCVAYKLDYIANYAIVLDGHHRLLASMLEGLFTDCLLISSPYYQICDKPKEKTLNLSGHNITKRNPGITDLPDEAWEILERGKAEAMNSMPDDFKRQCYEYYRNKNKTEKTFAEDYEGAAHKIIENAVKNYWR